MVNGFHRMNQLSNAFSWLNLDVTDNRDDTEILGETETVNGRGKAGTEFVKCLRHTKICRSIAVLKKIVQQLNGQQEKEGIVVYPQFSAFF